MHETRGEINDSNRVSVRVVKRCLQNRGVSKVLLFGPDMVNEFDFIESTLGFVDIQERTESGIAIELRQAAPDDPRPTIN
jgi:hypothetical protein